MKKLVSFLAALVMMLVCIRGICNATSITFEEQERLFRGFIECFGKEYVCENGKFNWEDLSDDFRRWAENFKLKEEIDRNNLADYQLEIFGLGNIDFRELDLSGFDLRKDYLANVICEKFKINNLGAQMVSKLISIMEKKDIGTIYRNIILGAPMVNEPRSFIDKEDTDTINTLFRYAEKTVINELLLNELKAPISPAFDGWNAKICERTYKYLSTYGEPDYNLDKELIFSIRGRGIEMAINTLNCLYSVSRGQLEERYKLIKENSSALLFLLQNCYSTKEQNGVLKKYEWNTDNSDELRLERASLDSIGNNNSLYNSVYNYSWDSGFVNSPLRDGRISEDFLNKATDEDVKNLSNEEDQNRIYTIDELRFLTEEIFPLKTKGTCVYRGVGGFGIFKILENAGIVNPADFEFFNDPGLALNDNGKAIIEKDFESCIEKLCDKVITDSAFLSTADYRGLSFVRNGYLAKIGRSLQQHLNNGNREEDYNWANYNMDTMLKGSLFVIKMQEWQTGVPIHDIICNLKRRLVDRVNGDSSCLGDNEYEFLMPRKQALQITDIALAENTGLDYNVIYAVALPRLQ